MNVLSLFDGMSCGQIALDQLGIKVDNYYAAEIDKYAIEIAKKNYPNTIHLGDVTKIKGSDLPKIDLLIGGSPCQGFSFAGKQLNFDDPRSALFFEFVRLLKECNPKYFLLENVRMKKEYQDVITEHLGVEPIMINSALVSAQNRVRLYWTNIPNITQPKDKGIVLKNILQDEIGYELSDAKVDRVLNSPRGKGYFYDQEKHNKIGTVIAGYHKEPTDGSYVVTKPIQVGMANDINGHDILKRVYSPEGKSPTLTTMEGGHRQPKVACMTERRTEEAKQLRKEYRQKYGKDFSPRRDKELVERTDDKVNCLTTSMTKEHLLKFPIYENEQPHKDNYKKLRDESEEKVLATQMNNSENFGNAVREKKAFTLRASNPNGMINKEQYYYRKLTPLECERLQTVPDGYTEGVSNTQRYKMLGNGWTVAVIKHIFKNL
jgi:DNA-cytosine methyltransferase